jgi:type III secretory pathway component EscS
MEASELPTPTSKLPAMLATITTLLVPILAEASKLKESLSWGIVLLCVVLGMLVTLQPVRREKDIKGRKD